MKTLLKINSIKKVESDHTWDISIDGEEYILPNGVVSHNTSAQISNSTNGVEPPRAFVSIKGSKDGVIKQVVPELKKLKNKYELLWDIKRPDGYLKTMAVLQKYIDQTISTNVSYNPEHYDGQIPMSELLKDILNCYKMGIKTLYYNNTLDGQKEKNVDEMIAKDSKVEYNTQEIEEDCDSCKI